MLVCTSSARCAPRHRALTVGALGVALMLCAPGLADGAGAATPARAAVRARPMSTSHVQLVAHAAKKKRSARQTALARYLRGLARSKARRGGVVVGGTGANARRARRIRSMHKYAAAVKKAKGRLRAIARRQAAIVRLRLKRQRARQVATLARAKRIRAAQAAAKKKAAGSLTHRLRKPAEYAAVALIALIGLAAAGVFLYYTIPEPTEDRNAYWGTKRRRGPSSRRRKVLLTGPIFPRR